MYEFFVNGFRVSFLFLFIIKADVNLVNFLSLPLCVASSVLKAHPMVCPVADLTDVHVIELKGGTFISSWRPRS